MVIYKKSWQLLPLVAYMGAAQGAAFQILEQNIASLGTAYSGTAVLQGDATAAFYNSAALVSIANQQVSQSISAINPNIDLKISKAYSNLGVDYPAQGTMTANLGKPAVIPALHYAARMDDRLVLGLSLAPSFGAAMDCPANSAARYIAARTELAVLGVIPSVAYRLSPQWSVGAGLDFDYIDAQFDSDLGVGDIANDGFQKNNLDTWGYGWHTGLLFEPNEAWLVGVHYRSMVFLDLEGISHTVYANNVRDQRVGTSVRLPESAVLSLRYSWNPQWAWTADAQWTHWNRFDVLTLRYASLDTEGDLATNPSLVTQVPQYFHNTVRLATGLEYRMDDRWAFRAGVADDPTPVQDAYRNARMPDTDRRWVALGAQYRWSRNLKLDIGYAHLFFASCDVHDRGPVGASSGLHLTDAEMEGHYKTKADILGIQISWDFV